MMTNFDQVKSAEQSRAEVEERAKKSAKKYKAWLKKTIIPSFIGRADFSPSEADVVSEDGKTVRLGTIDVMILDRNDRREIALQLETYNPATVSVEWDDRYDLVITIAVDEHEEASSPLGWLAQAFGANK